MAPFASPALIPITIFLILISLHPNPSHAARPLPAANSNGAELFVRRACTSTAYPDLCISSLASYSTSINGSPMLLAHTALSISLDGARSTSAAMKSMSAAAGARMTAPEAGAVSDCMENVGDSIDELKDSLSEMGNLHVGKEMSYKMNSIETWVSAALTDDDTCMDGFGGRAMDGSVKTAVRGHVVNVAHLTSNALALINALASASSSGSQSTASP